MQHNDHSRYFSPKDLMTEMNNCLGFCLQSIEKTVLEPSCGDGIFIEDIFLRRLKNLKKPLKKANYLYKAVLIIDCIKNIYGIDIKDENIDLTRTRLTKLVFSELSSSQTKNCIYLPLTSQIIESNFQQGDFLSSKNSKGSDILFSHWAWVSFGKLKRSEFRFCDIIKSEGKIVKPVNEYPLINLSGMNNDY